MPLTTEPHVEHYDYSDGVGRQSRSRIGTIEPTGLPSDLPAGEVWLWGNGSVVIKRGEQGVVLELHEINDLITVLQACKQHRPELQAKDTTA